MKTPGRRGLSLAALALAGAAVVATSPRRWHVTGPSLSGEFRLNTPNETTPPRRFRLALPPVAHVAGQQVDFTLHGTHPGHQGVRLRLTGDTTVPFEPLPGGGHQGSARVRVSCPQRAPCEATFTLSIGVESTAFITGSTSWALTSEARGLGEDPPAGTRLNLTELP
ncbi:MAG: hypothetical protein HY909_02590 [Deltaproteobacteria bacterium]|nr:hypothetical protein [Deltaproteobacteria bacterium]